MTIVIDETKALELIDAAVELRGEDFNYFDAYNGRDCEYAIYPEDEQGDPDLDQRPCAACLIGVGLELVLGLTPEQLVGLDGGIMTLAGFEGPGGFGISDDAEPERYVTSSVQDTMGSELAPFDIDVTENAARILQAAQDAQDSKFNWGHAKQRAHKVAELLGASA